MNMTKHNSSNSDFDSSSNSNPTPSSVLMVCLGNICRSPMAEEVFRSKAQQAGLAMRVDSCGTAHWHVGEQADPRSRQTAKNRGYDIDHQRARQFSQSDFADFDLILAMDKNNLADLQALKQSYQQQLIKQPMGNNSDGKLEGKPLAKLALFSEHDSQYKGQKVPDPYYGDMADFEQALDLIESMADAWIEQWL